MQAITRFPPSPTGSLHLGGARTALFNWLYAKKTGGEMVLRIEDTDQERSSQEATDVIMETMIWLGLTWNRGPFFQARRFDRYRAIVNQLLETGHAYHCFCSRERIDELREGQRARGEKPRYDRRCRDLGRLPKEGERAAVRFSNPLDGVVAFDDVVRGRVEISNEELDDLVILRDDHTPTYNLTVVVDDVDMGVSHVIRGEDHINNTPRQINIFRALGHELPVFAHVPLILGEDGKRLSKRHGAVSVLEFRKMGILPEALLNYLVRLGWSHGDQEIFDIDEMIEYFDIRDINKSPASFNMDKLLSINQHYIAHAGRDRLGSELATRLNQRGIGLGAGPDIGDVAELMRDRVRTLGEMADRSAWFYQDVRDYDPKSVSRHVTAESLQYLVELKPDLEALKSWEPDAIGQVIRAAASRNGIKFPQLAQPLRVAVSGSDNTPSIDAVVALTGRERTLERIDNAVKNLGHNPGGG